MDKKMMALLMTSIIILFAGCQATSAFSCPTPAVSASAASDSAPRTSSTPKSMEDVSSLTLSISEKGKFQIYKATLPTDASAEEIIAAIADKTGWDLSLSGNVIKGKDSMTICFAKGGALFAGLPNPQKKEFFVYDAEELSFNILDSVQETLRRRFSPEHPEALAVYYRMEGNVPLTLPGLRVTIPMEKPYTHEVLAKLLPES